MWFAAYFLYKLAGGDGPLNERPIPIQEDLVLLEAADGDEALRRALHLGAEVGEFGQQVLDKEPGALRQLRLEPGTCLVHPSNVDLYKSFAFLGLRDIVALPNCPDDGAEIDIRELEVRVEDLATFVRPVVDLQAFAPTGSAYSGPAAVEECKRLHARFPWYLADHIYRHGRDPAGENAEMCLVIQRLVLIGAAGPEEAVRRATENARDWERKGACTFVGLNGLSLVEDELVDCCELRFTIRDMGEDVIRFPCPVDRSGRGGATA